MVAHATGMFGGERDYVERLYQRSLDMNQNSAWAWTMWANYCARTGRVEDALAAVDWAKRLSPNEPFDYQHDLVLCLCEIVKGDLARAESHLKHSAPEQSRPTGYVGKPRGGSRDARRQRSSSKSSHRVPEAKTNRDNHKLHSGDWRNVTGSKDSKVCD
jgi:hypothetical protein